MIGFKNSYYLPRLILSNLILISLISLVGCSEKNLDLSKKYYKEGLVHFNKKEYPQALDLFMKSSDLVDNPSTCDMIGLTYKGIGDHNNAILWFKKAIETDPLYWITYINIGDIHNEDSNYEEAITWYVKGKEINSRVELPYMKLCDIFLKQGEVEKAIDECKDAIEKLAPYTSEPHFRLGDIYADKGLYDKAITEWKAAKSDPYYDRIYKEYDPVEKRIQNIEPFLKKQ
ncbi:MAG: tetratricopeptide repeat protein [Candidatus Omnitrophica bacterium]|nr:tetratricopeptide repeat protein [Candidatus Omnitrophota bacterium]MCG2705159.1 tetratricopeptide repeat protein [Candidatus Omnitrophota bacterium]